MSQVSEAVPDALDAFEAAYRAAREEETRNESSSPAEAPIEEPAAQGPTSSVDMMPEVLEYLGIDEPPETESTVEIPAETWPAEVAPTSSAPPPRMPPAMDAPMVVERSAPPPPADETAGSWGGDAWDDQVRVEAAIESVGSVRSIAPAEHEEPEPSNESTEELQPFDPMESSGFSGLTPPPRRTTDELEDSGPADERPSADPLNHLADDLFLEEPEKS